MQLLLRLVHVHDKYTKATLNWPLPEWALLRIMPHNISSQYVVQINTHTASAEPYSGFVLWILQFYAMLVKRFYMSIRFWQATLPQHLIPILSVLVALVIVVTLPDGSGNDPKRTLSIQNSAIDPDNRILFWAELGEDPTEIFNFEVRFVCPQ